MNIHGWILDTRVPLNGSFSLTVVLIVVGQVSIVIIVRILSDSIRPKPKCVPQELFEVCVILVVEPVSRQSHLWPLLAACPAIPCGDAASPIVTHFICTRWFGCICCSSLCQANLTLKTVGHRLAPTGTQSLQQLFTGRQIWIGLHTAQPLLNHSHQTHHHGIH